MQGQLIKYLSLSLILMGIVGCSGEVKNEDLREPRETGAMEPDGREPVMSDD